MESSTLLWHNTNNLLNICLTFKLRRGRAKLKSFYDYGLNQCNITLSQWTGVKWNWTNPVLSWGSLFPIFFPSRLSVFSLSPIIPSTLYHYYLEPFSNKKTWNIKSRYGISLGMLKLKIFTILEMYI